MPNGQGRKQTTRDRYGQLGTMRALLWALAGCAPTIRARRLYGIFPGAGAASEALEWRGEWR